MYLTDVRFFNPDGLTGIEVVPDPAFEWEFDFEYGVQRALSVETVPQDLDVVVEYRLQGTAAWSSTAPANGGIWEVRVRFDGTMFLRPQIFYLTERIIINRIAAPLPSEDIVNLNWFTGGIDFDAALVDVSRASDFGVLLAAGALFDDIDGETIYARNRETQNFFMSEYISIEVPARTDSQITMTDSEFDFAIGMGRIPSVTTNPAGIAVEFEFRLYDSGDSFSAMPPINAGKYEVRAIFAGNNELRSYVTYAALTINRVMGPLPTIADFVFDFDNETFVLGSDSQGIELSLLPDFIQLLEQGSSIPVGLTVFARWRETHNFYLGDTASIDMPARPAAPNAAINFELERINLTPQMQVSTDGLEWEEVGDYLAVTPGGVVIIRYKATAAALSSNYLRLYVPFRPPSPPAISLVTATYNSLTLIDIAGWEFRHVGGEWQTSNVFGGLDSDTEYFFEARVRAAAASFASNITRGSFITLPREGELPVDRFTVTFDSMGGTAVAPIENVVTGTTITAPAAPTRADHTFAGWYREAAFATPWNFGTDTVTASITLFARWTPDSGVPETFAVVFNSQGGTSVATITDIEKGSSIAAPTAPTRAGYTFASWYREEGLTTPWNFETDTVTANITLFARWIAQTFTVTFNSMYGTAVAPIEDVVTGAAITAPTAPTRAGYTFAGWYREEGLATPWNFETDTVTANITLFARWTADAPEVADRTALGQALNAAAERAESTYTVESWQEFVTIRNAAQLVYNNPNASQQEINAALHNLNNAMAALIVYPRGGCGCGNGNIAMGLFVLMSLVAAGLFVFRKKN